MDIHHYFIERGCGTPLIMLHGNGEDATYFSNQLDAFSSSFHVIALDTRGHGRSPRGAEPFTIRQFADDLHGFMERLNISKAHLLGFSDGGNIAALFAVKYPDMVSKLILNGANLNPSGVRSITQFNVETAYRIAKGFSGISGAAARKAEILGLMVNDPNIAPAELKKIEAKTLVIAGTHDMIKRKHTKLIADKIPDSKLVFIKGGHFIAKDKPVEFNRVVLDFLND